MLLSGSWDGTIRIWDIRTEQCLHVVYDHHADVYGLVSHPQRPFVFASSSRDTSLRFWGMDETLSAKIKIKTILNNGVFPADVFAESGMCVCVCRAGAGSIDRIPS